MNGGYSTMKQRLIVLWESIVHLDVIAGKSMNVHSFCGFGREGVWDVQKSRYCETG